MMDRKIKITVGNQVVEYTPHDFLMELDNGTLKFEIPSEVEQKEFDLFIAKLRKMVYN